MKGDTVQDSLDKKELGENLRRLRLGRDLTQAELAEKLTNFTGRTYTSNAISLQETGKDHAHAGNLFDYMTFFGVDVYELIPSRLLSEDVSVLTDYRNLAPDKQETVRNMLKFFLESPGRPT